MSTALNGHPSILRTPNVRDKCSCDSCETMVEKCIYFSMCSLFSDLNIVSLMIGLPRESETRKKRIRNKGG